MRDKSNHQKWTGLSCPRSFWRSICIFIYKAKQRLCFNNMQNWNHLQRQTVGCSMLLKFDRNGPQTERGCRNKRETLNAACSCRQQTTHNQILRGHDGSRAPPWPCVFIRSPLPKTLLIGIIFKRTSHQSSVQRLMLIHPGHKTSCKRGRSYQWSNRIKSEHSVRASAHSFNESRRTLDCHETTSKIWPLLWSSRDKDTAKQSWDQSILSH